MNGALLAMSADVASRLVARKGTGKLFAVSPAVRRLLATYDSATPEQLASGLGWYADARKLAEQLARTSGHSPEAIAAVIAVCSPRLRWDKNQEAACWAVARWLDGTRTRYSQCFERTWAKVLRILDGENPANVVGGPKVTAFWLNIVGNPDRVTVDAWAARAATGRLSRTAFADGGDWIKQRYSQIETAYTRAAAARGLAPRDFQAVVWTVVRELV